MTRWARVGSTQKHHKVPGDSTPWEELSKDAKNSSPKEDNINRIQKGRIEKKKHIPNMGVSKKFPQSGFQTLKKNQVEDLVKSKSNKGKSFKNKKLPDTDEEKEFQNDVNQNPFAGLELIEDDQETGNSPKKAKNEKSAACLSSIGEVTNGTGKVLTKNQRKKARRKIKKLEEKESAQSENKVDEDVEPENKVASPEKVLGKKNSKKRKNRQEEITTENVADNVSTDNMDDTEGNKKQKKSIDMPVQAQSVNLANFINKDHNIGGATGEKTMTKNQWRKARRAKKLEELKASQGPEASFKKTTDEKSTASLEKDFLNKKQLLLEKLEKRKPKDGSMVLPSRVERKIFNIKRKLMGEGMSPKILAGIVRKERKLEEEKFKKTFSTRPCFNCREIGHLLSDCPLRLGDSVQETGLCFKCGSKQHTSYKCPNKVEGYPLAKCFVCKEQGHISKDCPKNEHGLYIKGGKCSGCGNVNHLRKDCPADKKKIRKEDDVVLTVGTINDVKSVDEEILEPAPMISKKKFNKPKVVKF